MQSTHLAQGLARKANEEDYWGEWAILSIKKWFGIQLGDLEKKTQWFGKIKGGEREGAEWEG